MGKSQWTGNKQAVKPIDLPLQITSVLPTLETYFKTSMEITQFLPIWIKSVFIKSTKFIMFCIVVCSWGTLKDSPLERWNRMSWQHWLPFQTTWKYLISQWYHSSVLFFDHLRLINGTIRVLNLENDVVYFLHQSLCH